MGHQVGSGLREENCYRLSSNCTHSHSKSVAVPVPNLPNTKGPQLLLVRSGLSRQRENKMHKNATCYYLLLLLLLLLSTTITTITTTTAATTTTN